MARGKESESEAKSNLEKSPLESFQPTAIISRTKRSKVSRQPANCPQLTSLFLF